MSSTGSPQKAKKKHKSLFDDDDFFIMKRKKSKTPVAKTEDLKNEVKLRPTQVTVKHESTQQASEGHLPSPLPSAGFEPTGKVESFDSDDLLETFHTAHGSSDFEADTKKAIEISPPEDVIEVISDDDDSDFEFDSVIKAHASKHQIDHETNRLYDFTVISKLGPEEQHYITCRGNETFEGILKRLKSQALARYVPYRLKGGCLIWIDGKSELKPFFKPSTLRIPEPSHSGAKSAIKCLYVPESNRHNFEEIYEEFFGESEAQRSEEDDLAIIEVKEDAPSEQPAEPSDDYFVIGLKGKDNKRIEAEVGPKTKIRALLEHYLKSKGIASNSVKKARLVFDDEDLDLDGVVGDTELEEEFEVQVYIN